MTQSAPEQVNLPTDTEVLRLVPALTSEELARFMHYAIQERGADDAAVLPPGYHLRLAATLKLLAETSLVTMLSAQMQFQEAIGDKGGPWPFDIDPVGMRPGSWNEKEITAFLRDMMDAAIDEAGELKDAIPWKYWSTKLADRRLEDDFERWSVPHVEHMQMEVVDLLRFAFNAALVLRMSPQLIVKLWLKKCGVSHERLDQGDYNLTPGTVVERIYADAEAAHAAHVAAEEEAQIAQGHMDIGDRR
jgi:hypothetical protein